MKSLGGEKSFGGERNLLMGSQPDRTIRQYSVSVSAKYPYPFRYPYPLSIRIRLGIRIRQSIRIRKIRIRPPKNVKNPYSSVRKNPGG